MAGGAPEETLQIERGRGRLDSNSPDHSPIPGLRTPYTVGHHLWRSHLNDLSIIKNRLLETVEKLCAIESFADVERLLLRGQGLSAATYQSYLTAVKQMYAHTDGLNPLQWTPADIESFYDALRARVGISTAAARIAGLRNFCRQVATQMVGAWESPFDIMGELSKVALVRHRC